MPYSVSVQHVMPRPIAVVRERMAVREISSRWRPLLDEVYATAREHALPIDGQNVFLYHAGPSGFVDAEIGVGARAPFAPVGRVTYSEVPGGSAATTTHWGDYVLDGAHAAVISWCREQGLSLGAASWEVYGHWHEDSAKVRTDVYYLLKP
jgi:effector-binding domain-containing protein